MAHQLEIKNGIASFAYVGKNGLPWHKLGTAVDDNLTPEEMAIAAGLTWTLEKVKVFDEEQNPIPGVYQLRRDFDKCFYGICKQLYKPVQPKEAVEFFAKFVKAGSMKMETAGSLNQGARIFALAEMQTGFTLPGGDVNKTYMLLSSPNRPGESMTVRYTTVRVVCANTEAMAIGEGLKYIKIPHTSEFDEEARDRAAELMGLAVKTTETFAYKAAALAKARASKQDVLNYVHQLTGAKVLERILDNREAEDEQQNENQDVILDLIKASKERTQITEAELNRNGKMVLEAIYNSPGHDMASADGTWWGAVNGVSYVSDHLGNKDASKRYESAWFGNKSKLKDQAFELALEYAGVKN